MTTMPLNWTVKDIIEYEEVNPDYPQTFRLQHCKTTEDFVEILHGILDSILKGLESDRNLMQKHSEDAINSDIKRQLNCRGLIATHNENAGGHADILIKNARYSHITEGKKVTSANNSYLKKGYDQLVQRYVSGTSGATSASLLIYCFAPDAKNVLSKWRAHLLNLDLASPNYANPINDCKQDSSFAFVSEHSHHSSGSQLTIRHKICSLHWAPTKTR